MGLSDLDFLLCKIYFHVTIGIGGAGFNEIRSGVKGVDDLGKGFVVAIKCAVLSGKKLPRPAADPVFNIGNSSTL